MPRVEIAETPTFETDDKRAQYARLATWNHGIEMGFWNKTLGVNEVTEADLIVAWKDLAHGNYLEGPMGIETIMRLTKNGAEDKSVQERGLTKAYAQEVRPFIRRGLLATTFGRRNKRKVDSEIEKFEQAKAEVADLMQKADEAAKKAAPKKRVAKPRAKSTKIVEAVIKHEKSVI